MNIVQVYIKGQEDKELNSFFRYYPVRIKNIGMDAFFDRQVIFDFKDGRNHTEVGIGQASINSLKSQGVVPSQVDKIGLRKNNTLANCSCLLDYGVGRSIIKGKSVDYHYKNSSFWLKCACLYHFLLLRKKISRYFCIFAPELDK
jgi:hypothetical protein